MSLSRENSQNTVNDLFTCSKLTVYKGAFALENRREERSQLRVEDLCRERILLLESGGRFHELCGWLLLGSGVGNVRGIRLLY